MVQRKGRAVLHLKAHLRIAPAKPGKIRHQRAHGGGGQPKTQHPPFPGLRHLLPGGAGIAQQVGGPVIKQPSRLRQLHAPAGALKERDLQLLLQLPQLIAQGRLGKMQPPGGLVDAAGVGNGTEIFQLAQLHKSISLAIQKLFRRTIKTIFYIWIISRYTVAVKKSARERRTDQTAFLIFAALPAGERPGATVQAAGGGL